MVTMGMPALIYRWYFGAHSLKSLERNILGFVGIAPIRSTLIGMVEHPDNRRREKWLRTLEGLGQKGRLARISHARDNVSAEAWFRRDFQGRRKQDVGAEAYRDVFTAALEIRF